MEPGTEHSFRPCRPEEAEAVFALVLGRMAWMDRQGIRQWNACGYDRLYPLSYYQAQQRQGRLYGLEEADTKEIVSAAVLLDRDSRWRDDTPALYLHNFVSHWERPGSGDRFLQGAEALAVAIGRRYLRLDSAEGNEALSAYYTARGFVPAGTCSEGGYRGILRQKPVGAGVSAPEEMF